MLVAILIPVLLLLATVLLERLEAGLIPEQPRSRTPRRPLRLEAGPTPPTAQRHRDHLRAVPTLPDDADEDRPPRIIEAA